MFPVFFLLQWSLPYFLHRDTALARAVVAVSVQSIVKVDAEGTLWAGGWCWFQSWWAEEGVTAKASPFECSNQGTASWPGSPLVLLFLPPYSRKTAAVLLCKEPVLHGLYLLHQIPGGIHTLSCMVSGSQHTWDNVIPQICRTVAVNPSRT